METQIQEKIRVVSLFENGQIKPILFSWRKRVYKVLQVIFIYSKNLGEDKIFYFSVQTEGGNFEISFNREKFGWELTRIFNS